MRYPSVVPTARQLLCVMFFFVRKEGIKEKLKRCKNASPFIGRGYWFSAGLSNLHTVTTEGRFVSGRSIIIAPTREGVLYRAKKSKRGLFYHAKKP